MSGYYYKDPMSLSLDGDVPLIKKKEQSTMYNYINSDDNMPFGIKESYLNGSVSNKEEFRGRGGGGRGGGIGHGGSGRSGMGYGHSGIIMLIISLILTLMITRNFV